MAYCIPLALIALGLGAASAVGESAACGSRGAQLQDLSILRRDVALDRAYSDDHRARALQIITESEGRAGNWTAAEFELQVALVVALADNGHSTVWSDFRSGRMNRLPVRLILLADGVFVVRARGAGMPLLGTRVDSIDGIATAELVRRLRIYRGGPDNRRDLDAVSMLESPQLLQAAGIAQSQHQVTLAVSNQGHAQTLLLPALAPAPSEPRVPRLRYLAAQRIGNEPFDWQSAFQEQSVPLWLQQPDRVFRLAPLPTLAAVYLQLKANLDAQDGEQISAFLTQARRSIADLRPQNIILDMRFDGGGDYTKTATFMADLPGMVPPGGRVFVITHATTFSAGISSVGFVKQSAPHSVTIVGETVGDRLVFYGEPRELTLPNSGIGMSYTTGLHDYLHGCRWFGPCFWVDWIYPIAVPTLKPDLAAPLTFASIAAGRDPAMEAIGRVR
jgi:hypothetical protein